MEAMSKIYMMKTYQAGNAVAESKLMNKYQAAIWLLVIFTQTYLDCSSRKHISLHPHDSEQDAPKNQVTELSNTICRIDLALFKSYNRDQVCYGTTMRI